ncbi:MAG: biotin-dependent carboxyltransferase family protein [Saprospiraceae bacterium]|nr:biotin-dependent carboxyltransferase family protein [Saprospiraceae bacterium]
MSKLLQIRILKSGLHTSIQDLGRSGWQCMGVPLSGAMDGISHQLANWLVGNNSAVPTLEMTLVGPSIEFQGDAVFAITGANMNPTVDGEKIQMWKSIEINKGGTLEFSRTTAGARAYLAIQGGWQVEEWLGSVSRLPGRQDILPDNVIQVGFVIEIEVQGRAIQRSISETVKRAVLGPRTIRILPGPEYDFFDAVWIKEFGAQNHTIDKDSNRMGIRIEQHLAGIEQLGPMISSGVTPGTLQITRDGQPILLSVDGPTTGGYHRLAQVIHADLHHLGQLKPGGEIHFEWVDLQAAYIAGGHLRQELQFIS